jgi:hypothetical protein
MAPRVAIKGPVKVPTVPSRPAKPKAVTKANSEEWETF